MSKTVSTCVLETNLVAGEPQENIFFHTLYRTKADFPNEFVRTARSTSPVQVVAIFSTQGPDTAAAMLNLELNEELSKIVASVQGQTAFDYEAFSNQVVNTLNVYVCNYVVSHGGASLKTSMTMAVIEGDTLRVIHIGNTKAVLVRDGRIMALTEEQTVAHRYVQMGAITPNEEANHPQRFALTQYLGKLPQDGQVVPDKRVHLKLKDSDRLCIMGIGIAKLMPANNRNQLLVSDSSTEMLAHNVVNTAGNIGVKYGLSFVVIDIESTLLLPGDAVLASNVPLEANMTKSFNASASDDSYSEFNEPFGNSEYSDFSDDSAKTAVFNRGSEDIVSNTTEKTKKGPSAAAIVIRTIVVLALCALLGFAVMYGIFYSKGMVNLNLGSTESYVETVMYVKTDGAPLYSKASDESTVITTLAVGDTVTFVESDGSFSKVNTTSGASGYILSVNLTSDSPDTITTVADSDESETYVFIPDSETVTTEESAVAEETVVETEAEAAESAADDEAVETAVDETAETASAEG